MRRFFFQSLCNMHWILLSDLLVDNYLIFTVENLESDLALLWCFYTFDNLLFWHFF